jgi:spore maturation protein SpmB
MVRLFPDVPANHPAMGAMVMNFSANLLGLGNAATPFGIRAMEALQRLNPHPERATNAMAMFLALNTSGLTLLPTGVIALRASLGSTDPAAIFPTTLIATACSTLVAGFSAWALARLFPSPSVETPNPALPTDSPSVEIAPYPLWATLLFFAAIAALVPLTWRFGSALSAWLIPGLIVAFLLFGAARRVALYEAFVDGARDGFQVALRIIPYLVAILVAVGMFRASGALEAVITLISPLTTPLGMPAEALPMALLRPFSGSGAYAVMAEIMSHPETGPDTLVGWLVSTIQGSTETTFYVLAVYFGAVGVKRVRHTLAAAILADLAGIAAAVVAVRWLYGS